MKTIETASLLAYFFEDEDDIRLISWLVESRTSDAGARRVIPRPEDSARLALDVASTCPTPWPYATCLLISFFFFFFFDLICMYM